MMSPGRSEPWGLMEASREHLTDGPDPGLLQSGKAH